MLTAEEQQEKEDIIKLLTKRLAGPLADEHGNVTIRGSFSSLRLLSGKRHGPGEEFAAS